MRTDRHDSHCKDHLKLAPVFVTNLFCIAGTGTLLPKFRWHRSRWGRYCPVELANGNMVPGRMEFAVGYVYLYNYKE